VGSAVGVTVVFTDLVGSTELSTRVGAAETERLRGIHFGLLRDAVADHDGREVKNLGDGVMAVFWGWAPHWMRWLRCNRPSTGTTRVVTVRRW
jgi:Adenylate and Guanylate cyclase catalytic domain